MKIQFQSNEETIHGKFYSASGDFDVYPTVLLLSGFPGNEEDVLGIGEALSQNGINALTFNYRGIYQSTGEYSLANTQEDIQAAFDFLLDRVAAKQYQIDATKLALGGWSYGGGMALTYAANHPEVELVFSIAGTDHGEFAREYVRNEAFANFVDEIFEDLKSPRGPVRFLGKSAIRAELIQNPDPYDLLSQAQQLAARTVLLIGGLDDENVVFERHVLPFYRALRSAQAEKVLIKAFQDNHVFENSREKLVSTIVEWISRL